jgi:hypothetical protein
MPFLVPGTNAAVAAPPAVAGRKFCGYAENSGGVRSTPVPPANDSWDSPGAISLLQAIPKQNS